MSKIKILALTCGGISVASSRLRSFYPFQEIDSNTYVLNRVLTFKSFINSDVVHFQKTLTLFNFLLNIVSRLFGKVTIFDVDDQPHNLLVSFSMNLNVLISSVIVVDTVERREYWINKYFFKKVIVIPDVCDVEGTSLPEISYPRNGENLRLVWIGHPTNIMSIKPLLNDFQSLDKYSKLEFTVITNLSDLQEFISQYPEIKFVQWRDNILLEEGGRYHFMILNHEFGGASRMKSENKMVLSFMAGIMPIVSNTPSYKRLACKVGLEQIVFDDLRDVLKIIGNLDIEVFAKISEIRFFLLNQYSNYRFLNSLLFEVNSLLFHK